MIATSMSQLIRDGIDLKIAQVDKENNATVDMEKGSK